MSLLIPLFSAIGWGGGGRAILFDSWCLSEDPAFDGTPTLEEDNGEVHDIEVEGDFKNMYDAATRQRISTAWRLRSLGRDLD